MINSDQSALKLANGIRDCLSMHMKKFDATQFQEMMASAIMAMYIETARLKSLLVGTGDVKPEDFDKVFNNGVSKHYADHKESNSTH